MSPAERAATLRELDELANGLDAADAEDHAALGRCLAALQRVAAAERGLETLVERFAGTPRRALARALFFVLAECAGEPGGGRVGPLAVAAAAAFRAEDDAARTNLLTALHRCAIHGSLWTRGERPPDGVYEFLIAGVEGGPLARSAAVGLLARLQEDGLVQDFGAAREAALRAAVQGLSHIDDDLLQLELEGLADWIAAR